MTARLPAHSVSFIILMSQFVISSYSPSSGLFNTDAFRTHSITSGPIQALSPFESQGFEFGSETQPNEPNERI